MASRQTHQSKGLGRKRRDAMRVRRAARDRAAILCTVLGLGLAILGHPETFRRALGAVFPGLRRDTLVPPAGVLFRTAESAAARGRYAEAAYWEKLFIAQYPDHLLAENALSIRIRALVALDRMDEAQDAVTQFRGLYPQSESLFESLLELGESEFTRARYDEAARCYTDLIGLVTRYEGPQVPQVRRDYVRPSPRHRLARHRAAQRLLASRAEMERVARFNLALCYDHDGNRNAALRAYEHFVRRFPTDPRQGEAYFRMGVLERDSGRLEPAVEAFTQVCEDERAPDAMRAASIYRAGRCLEDLGRPDAARQVYRRAVDLRPRPEPYRLAALTRLAVLLRDREPLRALEIYQDLAENSTQPVRRAIAVQNLTELQEASAMAATAGLLSHP